jgi:hypothetical protein
MCASMHGDMQWKIPIERRLELNLASVVFCHCVQEKDILKWIEGTKFGALS